MSAKLLERPGFTQEQLDKFSTYSYDLQSQGFTTAQDVFGRVFQSDIGNCLLARLDQPIASTKGKLKYLQTEGKGERFFKLFLADLNDSSVILVEGVYKALAAYICGKNVIAYSGVTGAFEGRRLHAGLVRMLEQFQSVQIGFDIDKTLLGQLFVEHHVLLMNQEIKQHGKQCTVTQAWDKKLGKDFDEILVNHGWEKLAEILSTTADIFDWNGISATNAYTATHSESTEYILQKTILDLIDRYKVLFMKAPMGSGKTYGLAAIFKTLHKLGGLVISPLRALGRQITKDLRAQGIDITYRDDMEASANWERIVCCLESISTAGKLKIKPDGSQLLDKILVIDEVVAVISNLLEGSTISKTRAEVVELITAMLRSARKCVCMSADLTDFHCDVVLKLLGDSVTESEVCKYENTLPRNKFKGSYIGTVQQGISFALRAIKEGCRVFLGIDSQKTTSTYGTGNLAALFEKSGELFGLAGIPKEKILIIDSVTSTTKGHEAYEVIAKGKKEILKNKLLVIVSPSVESGFSLKSEEYCPDMAILCHMGCTAPTGIIQLTMRLRDLNIPRFFCFGGYVENQLSCGGAINKGQAKSFINTQIKLIESATNAKYKNNILKDSKVDDVLNLSLKLDIDGLNLEDEFYQLQAINNLQKLNREFIIATALRAQGATIEQIDINELGDPVAFKKDLLAIKERRVQEEAAREFIAPNLTDKEVESLKEQPALTQEQQDSMSKFYAQKTCKYNDVSVEDLKDKKYGLLEPEELGFFLQEGREHVEFHEQERILRQQDVPLYNTTKLLESDSTYTKIFKHDAIKGAKAHKIHLAESLGFTEALNYAKNHGIADLFLMFKGLEYTEKPEPILNFIANLKTHAKEWCTSFNWQHNDCARHEITIFEKVLQIFGYKFSNPKVVKYRETWVDEKGKDRYRTRRINIFNSVSPTRSAKAREKRIAALYEDTKTKYSKFVEVQQQVTVGLRLMSNEPVSNLLQEVAKELLLESAKRLPRKEYGLSKHSAILMDANGFQANVDTPIVIVNPDNVTDFAAQLEQWIIDKTEVGFDTETYGSAIHDAKCILKNGKRYWLNPQTGKLQQVKPGLDQNHNQVRVLQFSDGLKTYVVDLGRCDAPALPLWLKEAWLKIQQLCKQNVIVGHNLKFDTSSVKKYGLIIKRPYCTMLVAQLVFGDCGAGKVLANGNGLKSVAHNLLGLAVDKTEQFSDWGAEVLTESQITYAAKDAVLAIILKKRLQAILENPEQWGLKEFAGADGKHANLKLVDLENKNIYHTTEMQWRGVPVDVQKLRDRVKKLESVRAKIEEDWKALLMPCTPQQAKKITEEMNRRYIDRQHPFDPQEFAEALGLDVDDSNLELPTPDKPFSGSGKDVINDNSELPEFMVLKAWRAFNTGITQLSKVLLSSEINNGVCRTEYKPLSGTGRMACGNEYGLGTPNLQAFVKKAEGKYFGFIPANGDTPKKFWEKPSVAAAISIRDVFALTDDTKAFFTEDANASHARLAVGFGKCEFGRSVLDGMDGHSMFAMLAIQAMLADKPDSLDGFPQIRDFVKDLTEAQIRTKQTCSDFKELDKKVAGERFRSAAKTLFYSVLNGAQADKMRKVMMGASGSSVSVDVGKVMFDKFWNLYQGIAEYIKKILAEAEANSVNYGGIEFNITTLPDGIKLAYARKDGELAVTNIIACQWSRSEATALKKVMASVEEMSEEWGAILINMVHDEVGVTCAKEHWQDAYRFTSDQFAKEYDVYLQGFLPGDDPTEVKLQAKLAKDAGYVPTSWADK